MNAPHLHPVHPQPPRDGRRDRSPLALAISATVSTWAAAGALWVTGLHLVCVVVLILYALIAAQHADDLAKRHDRTNAEGR